MGMQFIAKEEEGERWRTGTQLSLTSMEILDR